jgi:ornithine decarboxylase
VWVELDHILKGEVRTAMTTLMNAAAALAVSERDPSTVSDSTPFVRLDPRVVRQRFTELTAALPGTAIHYAVKANPHPAVLSLLVEAGSHFDVASPAEVVACLDSGATADQLLYSNPIKRRTDLQAAYDLGVRLYVVDCLPELLKMAQVAPRAQVLCRLLTSGSGSDWPLSRKFGCGPDDCMDILATAAGLGMDVAGVAFHVGSQQRDPESWRAPIVAAGEIFDELRGEGIEPWLLDLGGGFPAGHVGDQPALERYGAVIRDQLRQTFGDRPPRTVVEPGRGLVGDAGVLHATVVAVSWRGGRRWVYLDAGVFTGLVETLEEAIRYRISTDLDGTPEGPVVLAGPTCDSADVLYEKTPVNLPLALKEGDQVRLLSTGAYTTCYSTVGFNGFPPLPTQLV